MEKKKIPPPPATKPSLGQFTALLHLQFELFTAILSGLGTFLITRWTLVVMVSPCYRHVTSCQIIINKTADLLYLYLRNLITKGVSSCFEEL